MEVKDNTAMGASLPPSSAVGLVRGAAERAYETFFAHPHRLLKKPEGYLVIRRIARTSVDFGRNPHTNHFRIRISEA